jgi:23S rRNA pseudouridine1911/1915/1917 synthase
MFKPEQVDRSGAPRLALHATELEFEHPVTGQRLHFDMELPQDLELFVARLRAQALKGESKAR